MVESIKELKKLCQKPAGEPTSWIARVVGRRFSIYLTKLLLYTPITANQVTTINLIIQLIGAILLFTANLKYMLIGILIINFGYLLDHVDGEIARYRKKFSLVGLHIDNNTHQIIPKFMYFGLAFSVYLWTNNLIILLFGFLCVVFSTSIINITMCWMIVCEGLAMKRNKSRKKHLESVVKKRHTDNLTRIGQISGKSNFLYIITNKISAVWRDPYDKMILLLVIVLEIINVHFGILPTYILFWYIIFYGILFTSIQIASFIVHIRAGTIEKYFKYLFFKK